MIRILIVDDSKTMQMLLRAVFESDPEIEVVGVASDPYEAREKIKLLNPDLITLDVEMPGMNGMDFLKRIMALRPMPVVMISSLTTRGADASVEALALGALACLAKPNFDDEQAISHMCETVKIAAKSSSALKINKTMARGSTPVITDSSGVRLILIGASTGGVEALGSILSSFPADCPPTVITQHIPERFAQSLALRLNKFCSPSVKLAENQLPIERGHVYLAPGTVGHTSIANPSRPHLVITNNGPHNGHMPSVDILFNSVSSWPGRGIAAALLTGMGKDGAEGLLKLKTAGAYTIAQDRETSVVYGMPAAAKDLGAACDVLPLQKITEALFAARR